MQSFKNAMCDINFHGKLKNYASKHKKENCRHVEVKNINLKHF